MRRIIIQVLRVVLIYVKNFAGFDMMSDGPLMGPGGGPPPPHPPNMGPNRGPPPGPPGGHGDWVNDMDMFSGEDQNFNPHPGNNFFGSPM